MGLEVSQELGQRSHLSKVRPNSLLLGQLMFFKYLSRIGRNFFFNFLLFQKLQKKSPWRLWTRRLCMFLYYRQQLTSNIQLSVWSVSLFLACTCSYTHTRTHPVKIFPSGACTSVIRQFWSEYEMGLIQQVAWDLTVIFTLNLNSYAVMFDGGYNVTSVLQSSFLYLNS